MVEYIGDAVGFLKVLLVSLPALPLEDHPSGNSREHHGDKLFALFLDQMFARLLYAGLLYAIN